MDYTKVKESQFGWHIAFGEPVTEANFHQAFSAALELAKIECPAQNTVAINFEALGISV